MAASDPRILPQHLEKLRLRLEAKQARLALLDRRQGADSSRLSAFPMGPGSGNASSRKAHYRAMDASINQATEAVELRREINLFRKELEAYAAGKIDERGRRRPPSPEALKGLISAAETALRAGTLKGAALDSTGRQAVKDVLAAYRRQLRQAEKADRKDAPVDLDAIREGVSSALVEVLQLLEARILEDASRAGVPPRVYCPCTEGTIPTARQLLERPEPGDQARLLGALVEATASLEDHGVLWPEGVAVLQRAKAAVKSASVVRTPAGRSALAQAAKPMDAYEATGL